MFLFSRYIIFIIYLAKVMHKKTKTFYNLEFRTERIVERERKRNNARPSDRGQARPGEGRGPLALAERLVGTAVFYCHINL